MIRLICTDVDGTLVGASGRIHPDVWSAVDRARATGIRLAVCSGRPGFGETKRLAERISPEGWHSFQTGASIIHLPSGRSRSAPIPAETIRLLVERARATGRVLELYTDDDYAVEAASECARAHASLLGVPFQPRPFESLRGAIVRAQWLVPHEHADAVCADPHPGLEITPSTAPLMPETLFVNLTPSGVDKGSSVRALADEYGVPLDEVMFVGDGSNDVSALAIVGHPVAMGNADPGALALARHCVNDADEGGVAQALAIALALANAA